MDTKQPKHQVEFYPDGGYGYEWPAYGIPILSLPGDYEMLVEVTGRREVPELRELLESVAKFLDAEWETRMDYPYEIMVRLGAATKLYQ